MKRKSYSREFKISAVKMILEEGMSIAQVSRNSGVNENSLHNWKKKYFEDISQLSIKFEERRRRSYKTEFPIYTNLGTVSNRQRLHSYLDYSTPEKFEYRYFTNFNSNVA